MALGAGSGHAIAATMLAVGALVSVSSTAAQAPDLVVRTDIEDPGGHALDAFHAALRRAEAGEGRARITVFGASHIASDQMSGSLRERLVRRFGDAGPGFVLPAAPFLLYGHRQVRVGELGGWRALRVRGRDRPADDYGVMGVALESRQRAVARVLADRSVDRALVLYARRPGGGTLTVQPDEHAPVDLGTRGRTATLTETIAPPDGFRALSFRAEGRVRLFGVSLERDRPGVIVDAMGIPGARIRDRLPWRDASFATQLRALAPDLVVLAYGTNESGFTGRSLRVYAREADEALRRARAAAPDASCLWVGPSDWPERGHDGVRRPRARTAEIIRIQRAVAARHGCGFFDLVHAEGGPGAMVRWVERGLALSDHVHFTDAGYALLADELARALLRGL